MIDRATRMVLRDKNEACVPLSAPTRSTFDVPLALGETSRSILRVRVLGPNRLSMYENAWRLDEDVSQPVALQV